MVKNLPDWAAEMVGISESDECQPTGMEGVNVVLNRARLAEYLSVFMDDRDVHDLLILDAVADAAGLPLTSTGLAERRAGLCLRPFRIWEYSWLYKVLRLSRGRMRVLDLGGPGSHLSLLAALAGCSVTSIDVNAEFVRAAQECAAALKLPNLVSRVGDMRDLEDFPSETFDIVISCSVLEHLTAGDQEAALAEMARVLKPGGLVGLTFDYGLGAPGANIYLPPPHDPPATPTEVVYRYARAGLVVAGNPFDELPLAGSLFHDDTVRYTVAALFLAKPPVVAIRPPQPEPIGSALGGIVIDMLPARFRTRALALQALQPEPARTAALEAPRTSVIAERDGRIAELESVADARRSQKELQMAAESDVLSQRLAAMDAIAAERLAAMQDRDREILARDERIAGLEATAAERLAAMQDRDREILIRDERIAGLEATAAERLAAMQDRDREILVRDERIAGLEATAAERLVAMEERDREIVQRDERIAVLEATAAERLDAMRR
jgi:ubiquinone/menaquinone biosynthesis C-methylase UbiE